MGGRDHDAVGKPRPAAAVGAQDSVGDGRRRRELIALGEHDLDGVRGQHLESALDGGFGHSVRIQPEEKRAVDALAFAVCADGLGDGQDVGLVEGGHQRRPAVPRRPEHDPLFGDGWVGSFFEVSLDEDVRIDEPRGIGRLSRHRTDVHGHVFSAISLSVPNLSWICNVLLSAGAR